MSKNVRRAAAVTAFVLVFGLCLYLLDVVLTPKGDTMDAFYAEPKNTIDVLFVGSSHATAAFDPVQMYQEQGFTSFNLFSWSQPVWTSYHYIKEALKTQSPEVVVLEAFGFMYGHTYLDAANFDEVSDDYSLRMRPSVNRLMLSVAMWQSQQSGKPFYRYASLLQWHNRWQSLDEGEWLWLLQDHSSTAKGFGPNYGTQRFAQQVKPQALGDVDLYAACEEYLQKMVALSEKQGFQLVIAAAPYIIETDEEWMAYNRLESLCAAYGVPFLDYNGALGAEIGFDFSEDMAEHAHVNLFGAEKLTQHIGAYLQQQFDLPDRRADSRYAAWQQAAAVESRDRARNRLRSSPEAARYLPRLADERFVAVVLSGGLAEGDLTLVTAGMQALGLPTGILDGSADSLLALLDGGELVYAAEGGALSYSYTVAGVEIEATAAAGTVSVTLNGEEVLLPYQGLFAVTLDKETGELVHSVVFRPEEGSNTRTD